MHTRTWHIEVQLSHEEGRTRAVAVLRTDAGREFSHEGVATRNPSDPDSPEIGDELATCRALGGLAQDLLETSVHDVEANVGPAGRADA